MDHYIKAIVVLCLALSHVTCQLSNEPADVPENFNTTSTDLGNEQQIKVVAPNGKLLATIEVFTEEGFEVQKPTDRNKCLMSKISDNGTCFDEVPVADIDTIPDNIAAFCKGREVLSLVPTDCNNKAVGNDASPDSSNAGVAKRSLYSTCHRWTKTYHSVCRTYCCRRFFFYCLRTCCTCSTTTVWTRHTITGYHYPY
ncbi:uncharacterized protein LOC127872871 isoform X1 [Dreissena polymorpha]|uniref:uncharacterized protein LOC127872871 isoform X1 n=1 Tax=Dreissena polymorpha TaxID=45954 RepID=UPI002264B3F8|nr:uncharacterized protein LOC127872871 isoform X1 [Dreissena polymorpha]